MGMGAQLRATLKPRVPSQHYYVEGIKGALSLAPIVQRDVSFSDSGCIFFFPLDVIPSSLCSPHPFGTQRACHFSERFQGLPKTNRPRSLETKWPPLIPKNKMAAPDSQQQNGRPCSPEAAPAYRNSPVDPLTSLQ